eukprot:CAMPEP_0206510250 /NCGR_PEP_ID=MMETSP0324_2-20121206/59518_1 /ASSEMBLY_ACC=CAM_ASM_000836 /TAXON_ID=2866 /ORGANISM="Crypthecodinium cohnii, Strain Seligo" /LENGTH=70 /DNA_ID=CAMNT_0054001673 /DNA_START=20 /DNA_END=232 /DNA_ORIENTATION=-
MEDFRPSTCEELDRQKRPLQKRADSDVKGQQVVNIFPLPSATRRCPSRREHVISRMVQPIGSQMQASGLA